MLLFILVLVNVVFAKENFQVQGLNGVTNSQALQRCFLSGKCTLATGCCNGHGVCQVNGANSPQCICGKPQDCRSGLTAPSYPTYTGATCDSAAIDSGCCKDGSDDYLFAQSGVCNKRDGTDPESGSKGRLLKRLGGQAWFNDSIGSSVDSLAHIADLANILTNSSRGVTLTAFNMMSLGFLQIGMKDIVHFAHYPMSQCNVTFNGTAYPKIKWQNNTGIVAENISIPKQFENTATATIDLGPLYDYAVHISGGPYINYSNAVSYWQDVHHLSHEAIVALKYYGVYHNYVARNIEEYFCGANSKTAAMSHTCTITVAEQYKLARQSTIRFSQSVLQMGALQILLENPSNIKGLNTIMFEQYFRRDLPQASAYFFEGPYNKIRQHQEFVGDVTRTDLSHYIEAGHDWLLSLRNPNTNTTAWSTFGGSSPCGWTVDPIASEVINLYNTKTQRFGSRIQPQYLGELELILYRMGELGHRDYKATVGQLTDTPSTTGLLANVNAYFGAQTETDPNLRYYSTASSVAFAATAAISDAIIGDRTGYFAHNENGEWTAQNYHPNSADIQSPDYGFANCYRGEPPASGDCTQTAENAATLLTGQLFIVIQTYCDQCRSRGALFANPDYIAIGDMDDYTDYYARIMADSQMVSEILHPLFYQWDGPNTVGFKWGDQNDWFLPNSVTDSIPTQLAWSDYMDGNCYQAKFFTASYPYPACSRARTNAGTGECIWFPS